MAVGLCDNCALKYADCKGNKDLEKCHCDYYKKPMVMNVKELAERVAELEIKLKDLVEVVRCKDCRHAVECNKSVQYTRNEPNSVTIGFTKIDFCSHGERR